MTKIFIESDRLNEEWYSDLDLDYSYLWLILKLNCNKGGIINLNRRHLSYLAKFNVDLEKLKELFKDKTTLHEDKLFINDFFADQNGYSLKLNNDAVRGRLKTYFENIYFDEKILRDLGYTFFIEVEDIKIELYNIKEFLIKHKRIPKQISQIESTFLSEHKENQGPKGKPIGEPIGKPRISSSISNSISNGNGSNNKAIKNNLFNYEDIKNELKNYPNILKIKKQLKESEFKKLCNLETPKKIDRKRFIEALNDLEENDEMIINESVFESLKECLILPF